MSLQHKNKSLPKHIQHVRLQKEEDEDQWISGEELCTEGSSDEESKVTDIKKKLKGSAHSSTSSLKSKLCSSSNVSIKEKSDSSKDTSSLKLLEWRPKRESQLDMKNKFYAISADRLDTEMKWKSTLEELQFNKNLYKNSKFKSLSETNTLAHIESNNKLLNESRLPIENNNNNDDDDDNAKKNSTCITDDIVSLDKEIDEFRSILEDCRKERLVNEKEICHKIKLLNICKITSKSTESFHKICKFVKERSAKKKLRKSALYPKVYSRANKFKLKERFKMEETPLTKLTKEQANRLESLLAENDDNKGQEKNCFTHTSEQMENIATINGKLKILQEKCDDADLNGKTSEETVDEENREWKEYYKMKDEKLRKINNRLKTLQNLKSTEINTEAEEQQ